MQQKLKELRQF